MPQRLQPLTSILGNLFEGFLMFVTAGVASFRYFSTVIDEGTWSKIKGTEGALFVVVIGIIAVWFSRGQSEKKADERLKESEAKADLRLKASEEKADVRHDEMMKLHENNSVRLAGLTAEAIKSNLTASHETANLTSAHKRLVHILENSPCVALTLGYKAGSPLNPLRENHVKTDVCDALEEPEPTKQ